MSHGAKHRIVSATVGNDPARRVSPEATLRFGACSDVGCVRENNEDSFLVVPELNLFVLSDGMGGMACGEVASRRTVETVVAYCRDASTPDDLGIGNPPEESASDCLANAIRMADSVVRREAHENPSQRGMGATVVAVRCMEDRMSFAHVGDSRLYLLRDHHLRQMTEDHSLVAELLRSGDITADTPNISSIQSVLIRSVGGKTEVEVDTGDELMRGGDTALLCSDGLTRELSEAQIASILESTANPQQAAERLVTLARVAGGEDNITVIVIRYPLKHTGIFSSAGSLGKWFRWQRG